MVLGAWPLNREFGGSFVYLVFVCSHLAHTRIKPHSSGSSEWF
jgi:hypothetical protein